MCIRGVHHPEGCANSRANTSLIFLFIRVIITVKNEVMIMNKRQAENEMKYRLIRILLDAMETDGLISSAEKEIIRKKLVNKLKPLIGQLD